MLMQPEQVEREQVGKAVTAVRRNVHGRLNIRCIPPEMKELSVVDLPEVELTEQEQLVTAEAVKRPVQTWD